ncbi:MAG TPA: hypothetical protein VNI77_00230 [Nitrososphaera sp.]|nr:hypothetical protein [Nitrososphaera sp.]
MAHERSGYESGPHMKAVAWSILVMGISLAIIIILYVWFGWMPGSNFSDGIMREQQTQLREQYGLPPAEEVPPELLETPPSLRNLQS